MAKEITDATLKEALEQGLPVVIDFWAEWCGPCKTVAPVVEELANDYEGKALICKIDVDSNPEASQQYGIRNIPTILFIKNGEVVDKHVGNANRPMLEDKLKNIL